MREMKLRYVIQLVSDIGAKARTDQQALTSAQRAIRSALKDSTTEFGALERAMERTAARLGVTTDRQAQYLARTATAYLNLRRQAEAAYAAMQRAGSVAAGAARFVPELAQAATANMPEKIAGAYAARRVAEMPIKAYATLEQATMDLKVAMTDASGKVSKDFERVSAEAVKLGNELPGTTKDFMLAARALSTQGVPTSVVANGGLRASAYTGVLLDMNQAQAAEVIAKLREAHGLKDNELVPMADLVQRAFFGFGIKPQDYLETAKYAASTYNTMGITGLQQARETLAIQGMAANVGLEASSFGTNYAMMLRRTAQIESRQNRNSKEAKEIKEMLSEHGIDLKFYDDEGKFGGNVNMLQQLAKLRSLNPLEQMKVLDRLFGVEAGRPAQIMVQKGLEGYNAALGTIDNQGDLNTRLAMATSTLQNRFEALTGTLTNLMAQIGTQAGERAKGPIDRLNEWLGGTVQNFFERNPTAGTLGIGAAAYGAGSGAASLTRRLFPSLLPPVDRASASATRGLAGKLGLAGLAFDLFGTSDEDIAVLNAADRMRQGYMGKGFDDPRRLDRARGTPALDALRITAPGVGAQALAPGALTELRIGEGKLDVNVRVTDERVTATTTVQQPLPLVRINPGNTNPGSYTGGRP